MRVVEDRPILREVVEKKGINAVKPVLTLVDEKSEDFWAGKAMEMSQRTLQTFVKEVRLGLRAQPLTEARKVVVDMQLGKEILRDLEKLRGEGDWETLMKRFLSLWREDLERRKPAKVEVAKRHLPAVIRRYVLERSGGCCEFPGCQRRYRILHHVDRFTLYKCHDAERIFALCKSHERLMHLGLVEEEEKGPKFWKVRLQADESESKYEVDRLVRKFMY